MRSSERQSGKREYFRLRYPNSDRPLVTIDGAEYEVTEVSECGFRLLRTKNCPIRFGQSTIGVFHFHDGNSLEIEGTVVRVDGGELVMRLEQGISFKEMMAEQRYVMAKYPELLDP